MNKRELEAFAKQMVKGIKKQKKTCQKSVRS